MFHVLGEKNVLSIVSEASASSPNSALESSPDKFPQLVPSTTIAQQSKAKNSPPFVLMRGASCRLLLTVRDFLSRVHPVRFFRDAPNILVRTAPALLDQRSAPSSRPALPAYCVVVGQLRSWGCALDNCSAGVRFTCRRRIFFC